MSVKDLIVRPIPVWMAKDCVRRWHYSGKSCNNSQVNLGVFMGQRLLGAMQFGPSIDKRRMLSIVEGSTMTSFLELNRMAFSDELPKNSESRALAVALRMIRKHQPGIEWVVSFADATQCGDGAIYRACGFLLTQVSKNKTLLRWTDVALRGGDTPEQKAALAALAGAGFRPEVGVALADKSLNDKAFPIGSVTTKKAMDNHTFAPQAGGRIVYGCSLAKQNGLVEELPGNQIRYILPMHPGVRERIRCTVLPYSEIAARGAQMRRGVRIEQRAGSADSGTSGLQPEGGGASPTPALHPSEASEGGP